MTRWVRRLAAVALPVVALGAPVSVASAEPAPARSTVVWGQSSDAAALAVAEAGGEVSAAIEIIGGVVARLDAPQTAAVEAAGLHVTEDAPLSVADNGFASVPTADHQLAAMNPGGDWDLDAGAGVGVALVDTGVTEVADLEGRVVQGPNLSGEQDGRDTYGHGTFMAGLIAGDGELSKAGGSRHVGVAPGAHIVSVKVAGADGGTNLSKVLQGIGWVVAHGDEHAVRVMNLSVAVPALSSSYQSDPLSAAVEAAWASGITVVAASGNDGSTVTSPGRDPWVVTVGALDTGAVLGPDDDLVPDWSGRGTSRLGAKPEVLAPGVSVVSLMAPGSVVADENPGSIVDQHYLVGSGTSMATAMTSGAVAVLTEHHAAATPDDFKAALVTAGRAVPGQIGRAVDLAGSDVVPAGPLSDWWQRFPIAFNGLGFGLTDRMPWALGRWANDAWVGNRWAGTVWTGNRWADRVWTGNRWASEQFAGNRWAGNRWAGNRWAGNRWAGNRWAGNRWAGEVWSGSRWAGNRWAGARFEGNRWAGNRWAGNRWADSSWAGNRWAGEAWTGSRWAGARWAGNRWAGSIGS